MVGCKVFFPFHLRFLYRFLNENGSFLDVGVSFIHFNRCVQGDKVVRIDLVKSPDVNVVCDCRCMPFVSDSFDYVICSHLLEHLCSYRDVFVALRECLRVARKEVVVVVPVLREVDLGEFFSHEHKLAFTKYLLGFFAKRLNARIVFLGHYGVGRLDWLKSLLGMGDLVCIMQKKTRSI